MMAGQTGKGIIVEFDFAAMNGAELLFKTTEKFLMGLDGIAFDPGVEARHFAGNNYQGGLAEYFAIVKTKKTAAKAAKDVADAFRVALNGAVPKAVTPAFRNFVRAVSDRGVKVVISTRADIEAVAEAFEGMLSDMVVLYQETSATYGSLKWDAWRRACAMNRLRRMSTVAVTGSGYGVKSALIAGMGSVAVMNDHVAYQDFGGADAVISELSGTTAKKVLEVARV